MPVRIQLRRTAGWKLPAGAIIVARPSKWGNPFTVEKVIEAGLAKPATARKFVVDCFQQWLEGTLHANELRLDPETDRRREILNREIGALRGRDLACWCAAGEPCHADVLLKLANEPRRGEALSYFVR